MKILYILIFGLFAMTSALSFSDLYEWFLYKMKHSKSYTNFFEDTRRRNTYFDNRRIINEHNMLYDAGNVTYRMSLNEYSDLTHDEFVSQMDGAKRPPPNSNGETLITVPFNGTSGPGAPLSVDWRKNGAITDVKNQGRCGSCWAFSAVGAIEAHQFLKTGRLVPLSEQNLVDCSRFYGSRGCQGGWMHQAFNYIQRNGGIDTEQSYPYHASNGFCRYNPRNSGARVRGAVSIPEGDEQKLMEAIGTVGPVSVSIDASHQSFQHYSSGIYHERDCDERNLDHAVLVVGYGTDDKGNDYYLIKNSWGKTWGENGFMRIARSKNHCGIASAAIYPLV